MIKILFLIALAILPISAIAQDQATDQSAEPTRIEVKAERGEIHFIINGATKAVLDENGLKVSGDVQSDSFLHGVTIIDQAQMDGQQ